MDEKVSLMGGEDQGYIISKKLHEVWIFEESVALGLYPCPNHLSL